MKRSVEQSAVFSFAIMPEKTTCRFVNKLGRACFKSTEVECHVIAGFPERADQDPGEPELVGADEWRPQTAGRQPTTGAPPVVRYCDLADRFLNRAAVFSLLPESTAAAN